MEIVFSKELYSKEALLKTAFFFADKAYLHLSQTQELWVVEITPKPDVTVCLQDFENEMIRQETQITILRKNADLRKMILARALASTILGSADNDTLESYSANSRSINSLHDIEKGSSDFTETDILRSWFDDE